MISRWTQVAACSALVVLLAGCSGSTSSTSTSGGPTTTAPGRSSTTVPASSTTTIPVAALQTAVWPTPASATRYATPVAAATGFATDYLHMVGPIAGGFRQGDSRSGEVPMQPSTDGPVTTVLVRQLGADGTWWVLGAAATSITLSTPTWNAVVASPVTVRGMSVAFEGTVQVQVRADDTAAPVGQDSVIGGSTSMGPFSGSVAFVQPKSGSGAIVLLTISAKDGSIREATVVRVRFG